MQTGPPVTLPARVVGSQGFHPCFKKYPRKKKKKEEQLETSEELEEDEKHSTKEM